MENCVRCGFVLFALAAAAGAQSMIEHASVTGPAAAGATAGAVIGTKLNQTVGVLGAAANNGAVEAKKVEPKKGKGGIPSPDAVTAQQAGPSNNVVPNPGFFQAAPSSSTPAFGGGPSSVAPMAAAATPAVHQQQLAIPPVRSAPQPALGKEQILAELANIHPGLAREAVLEKLGVPAYRISYDDGGSMFERLRFRAGMEDIAIVELKNGLVDVARPIAH